MRVRKMATQYVRISDPVAAESLEGVSLICEVPANTPEFTLERAAKFIKYLGLALDGTDKAARELILNDCASALSVSIGLFAQTGYAGGGFWPSMRAQVGMSASTWAQTEPSVKRIFRSTLQNAGLPWIRGSGGQEYIANVALHSGIPDYCLEDWFRMLEQASARVGWTPETVLGWCADALGRSTLNYVDNPVRYIVQDGEQFVSDLAERSLEILRVARANPSEPVDSAAFTRIGLDPRFANGALEWVRKAPEPAFRRWSGAAVQGNAAAALPRIRLKPWDQEVTVALPPILDPPDGFAWSVRQDEAETQIVQPGVSLGGKRISTREVEFVVSRPVRMVEVRPALGRTATGDPMHRNMLPLVDPDEPLLIFDESGHLIARTSEIPAKPVWLLVQSNERSCDRPTLDSVGIEVAGPSRLLDVVDSPIGWGGWDLFRVDLSRASSISSSGGIKRRVAQRRSAIIETASRESSVLLGGVPVCTIRPTVTLPQDYDGEWRISTRKSGQDTVTSDFVARRGEGLPRNEDGDFVVDPFAELDSPLVGSYQIVVRGALGRGASTTVTLAEGLTYTCDQRVRLFTRAGLTACSATVQMSDVDLNRMARTRGDPGAVSKPDKADACDLVFAESDLELNVLLTMPSGMQYELVVRPESIAVSYGGRNGAPQWSHRPINIEEDQLAGGDFRLRIPSETLPQLNLSSNGKLLQVIEPNKRGKQSVNYSLSQVVESVSRAGSASIELAAGTAALLLARIAPKKLFDGGTCGTDDAGPFVEVTSYSGGAIEAFVWACGAPWLGAFRTEPDVEGTIRLPHEWVGLEPFVVHLRVKDDWDPTPAPVIPEPLRDKIIWPSSSAAVDLIAQCGSIPASRAAALSAEQLWWIVRFRDCLAFAFPGASKIYSDALLLEVRRHLNSDPRTLAALAQVTPSPSEAVGLLSVARLETVNADWPADPHQQQQLLANPVTCALAISSVAVQAPEVVDEFLIISNHLLGEHFGELLRSGVDPFASAGRFDLEADRLDQMPPAQLAELLRLADLLPRALLDSDSRSSAARELFEFRNKNPQRGPLSIQARGLVEDMKFELERMGMYESVRALRAREYPGPATEWRALSGGSLAWALAARHAAHGNQQFLEVIARYPAWSDRPFRMRKLAAIDLVLAEIYAARFAFNELVNSNDGQMDEQ